MIKNKEEVCFSGQMEEGMLGVGLMVNSMVEVLIFRQMELKEKVNGI
jgi:hypothetical protein